MADPLSFFSSVSTLLQLSAKVIKYLSDVKDARGDLGRLRDEVISAIGLLFTLNTLAETEEIWLDTVQSLCVPKGPLKQFQSALERLAKKIPPVVDLKSKLAWSFQKSEVTEILFAIERQKALFSLALQNDHLQLSKAINANLAELENEVRKMAGAVSALQVGQRDQEYRDTLTWLSALNVATRQNDIFRKRQEGTGKWLLESNAFKKWLDGTEKTLFCPGIPGAGKTVLTSIVVDHLEQSCRRENIAVAYIYCSYKEQERQTDANLIASLLQQLVQRNPFIPDEISSLYHHHIKKQTRPTLGEWSKLLESEIRRLSKVFIVIDALDECSDATRESFLAEIRKLSSIHLLITSRHISTIEREFEKKASVEIRASDSDVRRYLEGRIEKECRLARHVKADPTLKETIINTIVENSKGMFLLAQLHMDSLTTKQNRKAIRLGLNTLPKGLDDVYQEALLRIESQHEDDAKLAKQILSWISFGIRPLTVTEIRHALAVEPGDTDLDEETLLDEDFLVSVCAGLVTIDQESGTIRLVHYTVQEFFERTRIARFPDAHTNIATTCLVYLSFDVFADGPCRSDCEMEIRMRKYPFLEYAAQYWGDHTRGDREETMKELILKFLDHNLKLMCANQVMHLSGYRYSEYSQIFPKRVTGLHVAAGMGLEKIVWLLMGSKGVQADSKDSYGRTPLSWAAMGGHEAVVRLLLDCEDVDANSKDSDSQTPLWWAAQKGHERVVQLLLDCEDVDTNSKDTRGKTPIFWAAKKGHEAVVRQLLECKRIETDMSAKRHCSWPRITGKKR
jgi:Cdc6-like AAA superfamily ATPase